MQLIKFYTGRDRQDNMREDFLARAVVEDHLVDVFGGFTRIDTFGGWQSGGRIYRERGFTYECLTGQGHGRVGASKLQHVANRLRLAFDQHTVLYTRQSEKEGLEYGSVTAQT